MDGSASVPDDGEHANVSPSGLPARAPAYIHSRDRAARPWVTEGSASVPDESKRVARAAC